LRPFCAVEKDTFAPHFAPLKTAQICIDNRGEKTDCLANFKTRFLEHKNRNELLKKEKGICQKRAFLGVRKFRETDSRLP
jgi:hypothetical protein